ncbi:MAG: hypothetical protein ACTSUO_06025 [Candidatus Thorarchaeota archaeon]
MELKKSRGVIVIVGEIHEITHEGLAYRAFAGVPDAKVRYLSLNDPVESWLLAMETLYDELKEEENESGISND